MAKRLISVFLILALISSFSFAYAADSDSVLDGTGSGWSDSSSGYPSNMNNSWWRFIFEWVRGLFNDIDALRTGWGRNTYPSGYANSWYNRIKQDLDSSYSLAAGYKTDWYIYSDHVNAPSGYESSFAYAQLEGTRRIIDSISTIDSKFNSANTYLYRISNAVKDIHDVIANTTDVAMHNNMESSYTAVNDNFLSGSGGSSSSVKASAGEYGEVSKLGGIVRGLEPSGRNMSHLTGAFGDGDNSLLGWFTARTAQELNPIMNSNHLRAARSDDGFIDFLAPNIDLIEGSRSYD